MIIVQPSEQLGVVSTEKIWIKIPTNLPKVKLSIKCFAIILRLFLLNFVDSTPNTHSLDLTEDRSFVRSAPFLRN